jgi:hypothetical protein
MSGELRKRILVDREQLLRVVSIEATKRIIQHNESAGKITSDPG